MISLICLWYLGVITFAPTWYFVLLTIGGLLELGRFGTAMYNAGCKKIKDSKSTVESEVET